MDVILHYVNEAWDLLRQGFGEINAILGILIGLYFAYRMGAWKDIWKLSLGATLIYLIARILIPVIDHNAPIQLPPDMVEASFVWHVLALFLAYIVILAALFFVKTNVLKSGAGSHAHGH